MFNKNVFISWPHQFEVQGEIAKFGGKNAGGLSLELSAALAVTRGVEKKSKALPSVKPNSVVKHLECVQIKTLFPIGFNCWLNLILFWDRFSLRSFFWQPQAGMWFVQFLKKLGFKVYHEHADWGQ